MSVVVFILVAMLFGVVYVGLLFYVLHYDRRVAFLAASFFLSALFSHNTSTRKKVHNYTT